MFKSGFGGKSYNYWLGNELLHQLTKDGLYKLRLDIQMLATGQWYWAEYSTFIVDSEATKYTLTVSDYSGNAGDAMAQHNNMKFSTFDSDNDISAAKNVHFFVEVVSGGKLVDPSTLIPHPQEVALNPSAGNTYLQAREICRQAAAGSCAIDRAGTRPVAVTSCSTRGAGVVCLRCRLSVCLCVSLSLALSLSLSLCVCASFESVDQLSSFLACRYSFRISRSIRQGPLVKVKVTGANTGCMSVTKCAHPLMVRLD